MKNISFSPPDITEEEIAAVTEALRSGWITTGPRTAEFERQIAAYCGAARAVCLNSATAALELSLRALGIGPGDEVITSAYTYTASASVICHVGAVPVLVDTPPDSFHMTADCFAAAIRAPLAAAATAPGAAAQTYCKAAQSAPEVLLSAAHPSEQMPDTLLSVYLTASHISSRNAASSALTFARPCNSR